MALKRLTDRVNKHLTVKKGDRGCFVETLHKKSPRIYQLNVECRLDNGDVLTGSFKIAGQLNSREQTKVINELLEQIEDQNKQIKAEKNLIPQNS